MFKINSAQNEQLSQNVENEFCLRLSADIRRYYDSSLFYSDEDLLKIVKEGVRRARGYEISWQSAIADFVGLIFDFGLDYDQHPKIRQVLTDAAVEPNARINNVPTCLSEREWREMRLAARF